MAEIIGLTRIGKTTPAAHWFLRNLDTALYFACPEASSERDFLVEFGRAACVTTGGGSVNNSMMRERICEVFGPGGYTMIVLDEAHNVWQRGASRTPVRLEFLRRLRDTFGVGVALMATPQFTEHLAASFRGDSKWAPGQYDGRVLTYHLPETLSDDDLAAVARHHAPEFETPLIDELVSFAKRSQGYCGAMVNLILRSREAFEDYPAKPQLALLQETARRQEKGRRSELQSSGKLVPTRFGKPVTGGGK